VFKCLACPFNNDLPRVITSTFTIILLIVHTKIRVILLFPLLRKITFYMFIFFKNYKIEKYKNYTVINLCLRLKRRSSLRRSKEILLYLSTHESKCLSSSIRTTILSTLRTFGNCPLFARQQLLYLCCASFVFRSYAQYENITGVTLEHTVCTFLLRK